MCTKRCLGIGLVLVLSLVLVAVSAEAARFLPTSSALWDPGYQYFSFTAPVAGEYGIALTLRDGDAAGSMAVRIDAAKWGGGDVLTHTAIPTNWTFHVVRVTKVLTAGTYWVTVHAWGGMVYPSTLDIVLLPDANAGVDQVIDADLIDLHNGVATTATLSGSATTADFSYSPLVDVVAPSYVWKLGADTIGTTVSVNVSAPIDSDRNYTLTVTDYAGFTDNDSVQVTNSTAGVLLDLIDALPKGLLKEDTGR